MRRLITLAALVPLLVACGGSDGNSTSVTPRSAPTATPAVTRSASTTPSRPAVWSAAVARAQYLKMAAPGNAVIDQLDALDRQTGAVISDGTWQQYRSLFARLAAADDVMARAVAGGMWPVAAKPAADALVRSLAAQQSYYQVCGSATSSGAEQTDASAPQNWDAGAPEAMRIALGLPPPPT